MENINKYVAFIATIFITIGVLTYAVLAKDQSITLTNNANEQFSRYSKDLTNSEFQKYDGNEMQGSDVRNCIKEYLGEYKLGEKSTIYIVVKTYLSDNTYENGGYIDAINNFTDTKYIDPRALFRSELVIDANQVIVGIRFTQK